MKNLKLLVFALFLFLFFLASCATQSETAVPNTSKKPASGSTATKNTSIKKPNATATLVREATYTASSRGSANTSSIQIDTVIDIPSYNETAPAGILEQLAWAGRGGIVPTATPDPRCNGCSITMSDYDNPERWIHLESFGPRQKLRLVFYRSTGKLNSFSCGISKYATSSIVQVNDNGALTVSLNAPTDPTQYVVLSVAFDGITGKMVWENQFAPYGGDDVCSAASSCPGAPPQRLQVNKMAHVCTSKDVVNLRSGPGKSYNTLKSLVPGADITVIGGPKCANNWSWWQVRTESGFTGWLTEGGDSVDKYFLCPSN